MILYVYTISSYTDASLRYFLMTRMRTGVVSLTATAAPVSTDTLVNH
jgi:hypothetical protein